MLEQASNNRHWSCFSKWFPFIICASYTDDDLGDNPDLNDFGVIFSRSLLSDYPNERLARPEHPNIRPCQQRFGAFLSSKKRPVKPGAHPTIAATWRKNGSVEPSISSASWMQIPWISVKIRTPPQTPTWLAPFMMLQTPQQSRKLASNLSFNMKLSSGRNRLRFKIFSKRSCNFVEPKTIMSTIRPLRIVDPPLTHPSISSISSISPSVQDEVPQYLGHSKSKQGFDCSTDHQRS